MSAVVLSRSERSMEIEFPKEELTVAYLLRDRLLRNPDVVSATVLRGHPVLDSPKLYLEVSKGKPEQILRDCARVLREEYDSLETALLKAVGTA